MSNFLIDTHCHLNLGISAENIPAIIERAERNGVKYLQTICTKIDEFGIILQLAEQYHNIFASVGVHPDNCKSDIVAVDELIALSKHPKVISFGETGLDYYHPYFDKEKQKLSFENHISAAQEEALPVIVHTRDAGDDTIEILSSRMKESSFTGVIHCFTETYEFAKQALDLGLYISITAIVTFKNAVKLQDAVAKLPLDRILLETDAPYLAPTPYRGKVNEPAYMVHTAEFLANLFAVTKEKIAETTTDNARKLFTKANFL